jgi:hypothetical protein
VGGKECNTNGRTYPLDSGFSYFLTERFAL